MFLYLSVSHSVHGGGEAGVCIPTCKGRGVYSPLGRHPPEVATEAGGTHPTGMHSCGR